MDRKVGRENHVFKESNKRVGLVMWNEGGCCVKKSLARRSGGVGKNEV